MQKNTVKTASEKNSLGQALTGSFCCSVVGAAQGFSSSDSSGLKLVGCAVMPLCFVLGAVRLTLSGGREVIMIRQKALADHLGASGAQSARALLTDLDETNLQRLVNNNVEVFYAKVGKARLFFLVEVSWCLLLVIISRVSSLGLQRL